MKISVITVCWNSSKTISHTIDSFLAQNHQEKELIVVDGASTDGTQSLVETYAAKNIRLISEPDQGMYDALNKGLALVTGDAIGVLNSDDTYHDENVLAKISDALSNNEIVHGDLNFIDTHASKKVVRRWRVANKPARGFRSGWMPAHPTFYVHREVADAVGQFDLSYPTASDYDWMLRAVELFDFKIGKIDSVLIDMMQGGKSTQGLVAHLSHNREALRARQKWLDAGVIDYAAMAKPVQKVRQFFPRLMPR